MHHHHADADITQQTDVAREALLERLVDHGVSAVFHDESAVLEAPDVWQRFVQDLGFADEFVHFAPNGSSQRPGSQYKLAVVDARAMDILLALAELAPYVRET